MRWSLSLSSVTKFPPAHRAALSQGNEPLKFTSSTCFLLSWMLILTFKVQHSKPSCSCSLAKPSLTLCNPIDCSTPGFPVFHHLLELAQTHVHWVGDAVQTACPLSTSSPVFNLFLASGSFPISWPFASGGQSVGASASIVGNKWLKDSMGTTEWWL